VKTLDSQQILDLGESDEANRRETGFSVNTYLANVQES
jgi:hypothetical protein